MNNINSLHKIEFRGKILINNGKINICVIAPEIHDPVSHELLDGINSLLEINNVEMDIISAGGVFTKFGESNRNNYLYKLILNTRKYDGIIIFAGSLSNFASEEEVGKFLDFIPDDIPVLCLSLQLADYDTLIVDNYTPVKDIVSHLVNGHNKKRIAFIKGPADHKEAEERYKGYLDGLKENKLSFDKSYVYEGDYSPQAGSNAVKKILSRGLKPDAIICSDDDTALGVYGEFKKNSIDIVRDSIAVTGFDNMDFSKGMNPQLTTVDQSLFLQGKQALMNLLKKLGKEEVKEEKFIPHIILRESCGCKVKPDNSIYDSHILELENHIKDLTNIYQNDLDDDGDSVKDRLDFYINYYIDNNMKLVTLAEVISYIYDDVKEKLSDNRLNSLSKVTKNALLKIARNIDHLKINENRFYHDLSSELDQVIVEFSKCRNYDELFNALDRDYYYIGIRELTLFFPDTENKHLKRLSGKSFSKEKSLHGEGHVCYNLYLPILSKYEKGFCSIVIGIRMFEIAEVVTYQITRVLYLIELFNDLDIKINELQLSYDNLRETKQLLLESEYLSNLGGLVAGFTHEISTPIAVSFTAISHIGDELKRLKTKFHSNSMSRNDLERHIEECEDLISIVMTNLERTISLNKEFKQIAVDQSSDVIRQFELGGYIKEIIHSLSPVLKKTSHIVNINIDNQYIIRSYPGVFSQIIINLIQNSLIHGFENKEKGEITITIQHENNKLKLIYQDNGRGVKKHVLNRIFDSYYSTKIGSGGSGLGMAIIKKLVNDKLQGTIECFSDSGKGIRFIIQINN